MRRLGDLAIQDLLEGIHPLAVLIQSVLYCYISFVLVLQFCGRFASCVAVVHVP